MKCSAQRQIGHEGQQLVFSADQIELMYAVVRSDGRYEFTCSIGHQNVTILQQQDFEVLFDVGAHAVIDGYYREAVSSFTAALERFYEFYIKVVCLFKGLNYDHIDASWKHMSAQSERQLGAFVFLYTIEKKEVPLMLTDRERELRNNVIHKGYIPTEEEVVRYGERILELVRPILRDLKANYKEATDKTVWHHLENIRAHFPADQLPYSAMCMSTILSLSIAEEESFNNALNRIRRQERRLSNKTTVN